MEKEQLHKLLNTEDDQLQKLHDIVLTALEEEKLLSRKIQEFEDANPPVSGKIADKVAKFGGSWKFILAFLSFMFIWMIINLYLLLQPFDPYPFILLNLILSTLAAIQAPVILMSQNRKEEKDRKRSINDYLINLKSEIEIRNVQQKLDLLIAEQMKSLFRIQKAQIEAMDDIKDAITKIHLTHQPKANHHATAYQSRPDDMGTAE